MEQSYQLDQPRDKLIQAEAETQDQFDCHKLHCNVQQPRPQACPAFSTFPYCNRKLGRGLRTRLIYNSKQKRGCFCQMWEDKDGRCGTYLTGTSSPSSSPSPFPPPSSISSSSEWISPEWCVERIMQMESSLTLHTNLHLLPPLPPLA